MFQERSFKATSRPVVFRAVLGDVAQHRPRVLDVAVAPLVLRRDEEHVEAQAVRRGQRALDRLGDVAPAAPDRELARLHRPVPFAHVADAQADHGHRRGVGEVPGERLAPDLAAAVEAVRAHRRLVSEHGPIGDVVVAARGQRGVGRVGLDAAHGGAAARVDHPLHGGPARRLEDVVGADHVVAQDRVPPRRALDAGHVGGQVHDRVHVAEGGRDGLQVADVGLVRLHARDGAAVERPQRPAPLEAGAHRGADETAHARDQDPPHGEHHTMSRRPGAGRA